MPKPLQTINIAAPGFRGLNTQQKSALLDPSWATVAENIVIDDSGRLAARLGYQYTNTTALGSTPDIKSIHEYIDGAGNSVVICAAGNAIYKRNGTSLTAITGTITTPTDDNWKFVNFNGNCVGFQNGHAPIVMTSTGGSFADITLSGTQQPNNTVDEVLAAFGRLWVLDGTDLKYSDSLDHTAWNSLFDLSTVWLAGADEGVALAEFNGHLVIFGKNSIVVYNNPWDPASGGTLDTTQMTLVENIAGIGCIARDSVQQVGRDLFFLSNGGVRSLSRTIQEKSMPLADISKNNYDKVMLHVNSISDKGEIDSCYSQLDGMYLLTLPSENISFYFDTKRFLEDGSARMTSWDITPTALTVGQDSVTYMGWAGYLSTYTGYLDGVASDGTGGSEYTIQYESGWLDFGQEVSDFLKLPKNIFILLEGGAGETLAAKWAFDYDSTFNSNNIAIPSATFPEWDETVAIAGEWGTTEWGGGNVFNTVRTTMSRTGKILKFGLSVNVSGRIVAIQEISVHAKLGRLAA